MLLSSIASRSLLAFGIFLLMIVYSYHTNSLHPRRHPTPPVPKHNAIGEPLKPISNNIWQINLGEPLSSECGDSISSWIQKNPQHSYTLLTNDGANQYIKSHYDSNSPVRKAFLELQNPILRSDFLRYIVLATEGGIYSDVDTDPIKPISSWNQVHANSTVHAVIGLEYDRLGESSLVDGMLMPLQFCQWTLAFAAHHPLIVKMVESVAQALQDLASSHNTTLSNLSPVTTEVLLNTGPAKWSEVVFEYLSSITGSKVTYQNLTGLREPRLFDDVLILPIDGFGTGIPHSGSSPENTQATLIRHRFHGTWKNN
ncbi:MAG: hypothetical protein Q9190_000800 [Brigantiaea leucoxantha]